MLSDSDLPGKIYVHPVCSVYMDHPFSLSTLCDIYIPCASYDLNGFPILLPHWRMGCIYLALFLYVEVIPKTFTLSWHSL